MLPSLNFNQYFVVILIEFVDARCAVLSAVLIDSVRRQLGLGVNHQTFSHCRINATFAIVIRGGHRETTTSNACLLFVNCGFIVGFISFVVVFLLRAVLVDFIDDSMLDATVRPCTCILTPPLLQLTDLPVFSLLVFLLRFF